MKYKPTTFFTVTLSVFACCLFSFKVMASEKILQNNCLGCHVPSESSAGKMQLSRISHQRKTPEGWSMTIARMQHTHGLKISPADRSTLVKYLADTQGITPTEAKPYRYILERRLNQQESKQPVLAEMCARCHSEARIGLQRRETTEWEKLVHFHLGQWPSVEYSAMGRDRNWFEVAIDQVVPYLGENYGFSESTWDQWTSQPKQLASGRWRVVGRSADKGDFQAVMKVDREKDDNFGLIVEGEYSNGEKIRGVGSAVIYSGFEWRGALSLNGVEYRQVFSLAQSGTVMSGRMFEAEHEEMGIDITASKGDQPVILAVSPMYLKAGSTSVISIRGNNLDGSVSLPDGLSVEEVLLEDRDEIRIKVSARTDMVSKRYSLAVGNTTMSEALAVYRRVDSVEVFPSYAVARVGGEGSQNKVKANFTAKAFSAGPDKKTGTSDDFYIGAVDAKWRVEAFDQKAIDDRDIEFAGSMNTTTGVFTPGAAGPNPKRKFGTNNAGRLNVVATVENQGSAIEGSAELIVTVQRWNNPPIR